MQGRGVSTPVEPAFQAPEVRNRVVVGTSVLTGSTAQTTTVTLPGGYRVLRSIGFNSGTYRVKVDDGSVIYMDARADDVSFSRLGCLLQRPIPQVRSLNVTMTPLNSATITDCVISFMLEA